MSIVTRPFFVYGTLMAGEANAHFWRGVAAIRRRARVKGARLFDLGPYPMASRGAGSVCGELVEVNAARYEAVLRSLDRLEGVSPLNPLEPGGLYHRELVPVEVGAEGAGATTRGAGEAESVRLAWIYWGRPDLAARGRALPRGCWRSRFARDEGF